MGSVQKPNPRCSLLSIKLCQNLGSVLAKSNDHPFFFLVHFGPTAPNFRLPVEAGVVGMGISQSPTSEVLAVSFAAHRLLALRLPPSGPQTVASFLLLPKAGSLLSIKSVASFFKTVKGRALKVEKARLPPSTFDLQPSTLPPAIRRGRTVGGSRSKNLSAGSWVWTLQPSTFNCSCQERLDPSR
jgi:hypothetical protein